MFQKSYINLGKDLSGSDTSLLVYSYKPEKSIKHIYLQSGMHGGEITIRVLKKLMKNIEAGKYKNLAFTIVPLANPFMRRQSIYYTTLGKFSLQDGRDPNRVFPGNEFGSASERLAFEIIGLSKTADIVIDFHTSRDSVPFVVMHTFDEALIAALGMKINLIISGGEYLKTLTGYSNSQGVCAFTVECGSHDEHNEKKIQEVYESLDSYLLVNAESKSIHSESELPFISDKVNKVYSEYSGFISYGLPLGSRIKKGELLGEITIVTDITNSIKLLSPMDGILLKRKKSHIIRQGDEIFQIATVLKKP